MFGLIRACTAGCPVPPCFTSSKGIRPPGGHRERDCHEQCRLQVSATQVVAALQVSEDPRSGALLTKPAASGIGRRSPYVDVVGYPGALQVPASGLAVEGDGPGAVLFGGHHADEVAVLVGVQVGDEVVGGGAAGSEVEGW